VDGKLVDRRSAAADRQDAALNRWPDRSGAAFLDELAAVVAELRAVVEAGEREPDATERSRNHSHLGSALFDLGLARAKNDREAAVDTLCESAKEYERAQALLAGTDEPAMRAKLDFNYANTLRALSFGEDDQLLAMAGERYSRALTALRAHAPELVPVVEAALSTLPAQRKLAQLREQVGRKIGHLDELKRRFAETADRRPGTPGPAEPRQDADSMLAMMLPMLEARLEQDRRSGRVAQIRYEALKSVLAQLRELTARSDTRIADPAVKMDRVKALMQVVAEMMKERGGGANEPPPGTRAAALARRLADIEAAVGMERFSRFCGEREGDVVHRLITRAARSVAPLVATGRDDDRALAHEAEVVRPLAAEARRHLLRHHVMLAWPFWGAPSGAASPNSLHYAGGEGTWRSVSAAAASRRLRVRQSPAGADVADARWESISSSVVGVYDLTMADSRDRAAVCLELGIARSLGRPVVVLSPGSGALPFDIDVVSVALTGDAGDAARIGDALDDAIYGEPSRVLPHAFEATAARARELWSHGQPYAGALLKGLEETRGDATATAAVLGSLLRTVPDAPSLIYPVWPPSYPAAETRFCFHVMPLSQPWSEKVQNVCRAACGDAGVGYRPGDEARDPDIIRAIWDDICRATQVLVDLTGFNANVALEFGISCALGKKVLLTAQKGTVEKLFPMAAKMRVTQYGTPPRCTGLAAAVREFAGSQPIPATRTW